MTTTYSNKTIILADLWLNYRDDENFKEFVEYNDLGLPLAYAVANSIVESTPMVEQIIEESFDVLLAALGIEDTGFELFNELIEE
jgi:hypothetical protein